MESSNAIRYSLELLYLAFSSKVQPCKLNILCSTFLLIRMFRGVNVSLTIADWGEVPKYHHTAYRPGSSRDYGCDIVKIY